MMKQTTIKSIALSCVIFVTIGVAYADYSNYTEAINAGRPLYQNGDYVGAQKVAEKALAFAKTPSEKVGALIRLGATYKERRLNEQARKQWMQVLQLPGASAIEKLEVQTYIAESYGEEKNWALARAEFQKIVDAPEATLQQKTMARYKIAMAFRAQDNEVEAQNIFSRLAEDTQAGAAMRSMAYVKIGQGLVNAREFDKARVAYKSALELPGISPQFAILTQIALAQSYKKEGNTAKAQEEFSKAQIRAYRRARAFEADKQFVRARSTLEAALKLGEFYSFDTSPSLDSVMRVQISQIFLKEGKSIEARGGFESFLKRTYGPDLLPKDEATLLVLRQTARLGIAISYAQEKNKAQAQAVLSTLLAMQPLDARVKNAAEKLLKQVS